MGRAWSFSGSAPESGISKFLAKLYINFYHMEIKSEQFLQWLVRRSIEKSFAILGTSLGRP